MFIAIPRTFEGPFAVIFFTQLSSRELTIFPQTPTISDYPGFRRKASRSTRLPGVYLSLNSIGSLPPELTSHLISSVQLDSSSIRWYKPN